MKSKLKEPAEPIYKYDTLQTAKINAVLISEKHRGLWYIIESWDMFFVQNSCNLLPRETHHATYINGMIQ